MERMQGPSAACEGSTSQYLRCLHCLEVVQEELCQAQAQLAAAAKKSDMFAEQEKAMVQVCASPVSA